jgi:hypothetical protein
MELTEEARVAFLKLGLSENQLPDLMAAKPVAFYLSGASKGLVAVVQIAGRRLRSGIYTIDNKGGGLRDFATFETNSRVAAFSLKMLELELMGIDVYNPLLRAALVNGGFTPTTLEVPEDLGSGFFTDVISRVEELEPKESNT